MAQTYKSPARLGSEAALMAHLKAEGHHFIETKPIKPLPAKRPAARKETEMPSRRTPELDRHLVSLDEQRAAEQQRLRAERTLWNTDTLSPNLSHAEKMKRRTDE